MSYCRSRCFWFGLALIAAPWMFSYSTVTAGEADPVPITAGEMKRYLSRSHSPGCRDDATETVTDGGAVQVKKCYSSGAVVDDYAKCPPAPPITTVDHSYY